MEHLHHPERTPLAIPKVVDPVCGMTVTPGLARGGSVSFALRAQPDLRDHAVRTAERAYVDLRAWWYARNPRALCAHARNDCARVTSRSSAQSKLALSSLADHEEEALSQDAAAAVMAEVLAAFRASEVRPLA